MYAKLEMKLEKKFLEQRRAEQDAEDVDHLSVDTQSEVETANGKLNTNLNLKKSDTTVDLLDGDTDGRRSSETSSPHSSQKEFIPHTAQADATTAFQSLFFWIPFLTVMREGLESVLLVGGVSFSQPPTSIPLGAGLGLLTGCFIGFMLHKASGHLSMRWFFVIGSYILFLMAAGYVIEFLHYTNTHKIVNSVEVLVVLKTITGV